jgi:1,4-alpha-glucan branching enzyme
MLAPAAPMFLMGEEVGAARDYRYNDFLHNREDLAALREGDGRRLFRFYRDIIAFRHAHAALRSHAIDIFHVSPENRVLAFRRGTDSEELLVFASLANHPFAAGYGAPASALGDAYWLEVFNSDASVYGGDNVGNGGGVIASSGGWVSAVLPANGFLVFRKV